jgi:nucleotide-binding universal stress UspA family protein
LFQKILVPLDGSDHSLRALKISIQISKEFNGEITLIHVYSEVWPNGTLATSIEQCIEAARKAGADILADGKKKARAERVQVETLLKEGHPVEEILQTAKKGDFDLIVIGARGISRIRGILIGSVSDGVTRHAPCPVLVVKRPR